jgi:hypothetical protein
VPETLKSLKGPLQRWLPWLVGSGDDVVLGPIPKGTPVGLLANLRLRAESDDISDRAAHVRAMGELAIKLKKGLKNAPPNASDEELRREFANLRGPMLRLSKCPDLVVNRGHYFGTTELNKHEDLSADEQAFGHEPELTDEDRKALIAFLRTF